MPRILGHAFNPLSVYFCDGADGTLQALLYEVNNTFGERHSYLIAVDASPQVLYNNLGEVFEPGQLSERDAGAQPDGITVLSHGLGELSERAVQQGKSFPDRNVKRSRHRPWNNPKS